MITLAQLLGNTGVVPVIRDDTGEQVMVARCCLRHLAIDRVEILVPGQEGTGLLEGHAEGN